jgi:hypothetical protein
MVGDLAAFAAPLPCGSSAQMAFVHGRECDAVCVARRGAVADVAAGYFPALHDGAALFLRVARQRLVRDDQPPSADGDTPGLGPRSLSQCGRDR